MTPTEPTGTAEHKPLPASKQRLVARPGQAGIDPRGPRFGAGITAVLLLVTIGAGPAERRLAARHDRAARRRTRLRPARHRHRPVRLGRLRRSDQAPVRPAVQEARAPEARRAEPSRGSEAPDLLPGDRPRRQPLVGVALHLAGVPLGLVIPAAAAFIAAFLNSVFDYCFGCQIYLLLVRAGILGRSGTARGLR